MIRTLGLIFSILLAPAFGFASESDCKIPPKEVARLLSLDYQSFDQNPKGGWRAIDDKGCRLQAANLIETYRVKQLSNLESWQARTLSWHAGQLYALDERTFLALNRFKISYNEAEQPNDGFNWNLYVDASIAFLQRDLPGVIEARDRMRETGSNPNNMRIVESFVRCFDKPYCEAYNPECK